MRAAASALTNLVQLKDGNHTTLGRYVGQEGPLGVVLAALISGRELQAARTVARSNVGLYLRALLHLPICVS